MSICQTCPLQEGGPHLYHIYQEDGWVRIREHQVFPGIWLAFKDAPHLCLFPSRRLSRRAAGDYTLPGGAGGI